MTFLQVLTGVCAAVVVVAISSGAEAARKSTQAETIGEAMHSARIERGFVCYTDHFHYGSSGNQSSKKAAEIAAISAWSSFVDFEYGSAWANFRKAGSKKMTCSQGSGGWDCSVEARPCR